LDFPFDGHVTSQQDKPSQPPSQAPNDLAGPRQTSAANAAGQDLGQLASAERVGIRFSDVGRIENDNLDSGPYAGE
jgi:hypothetical protein